MKRFLVALFFAALAAPSLACESDQSLLNSKLAITAVKYQAFFYNSLIEIADHGVSPAKMAESLGPNKGDTCVMQAAQRQLSSAIKQSIARHNPKSVTGVFYFDKSHPKDIRYSVRILMQIEGDTPFVGDFYRWDGSRFRYIKKEFYSS